MSIRVGKVMHGPWSLVGHHIQQEVKLINSKLFSHTKIKYIHTAVSFDMQRN